MMDVSIIIVNFNTEALLTNCVRSVFAHTSGLNFEVIVVDNGSAQFDSGMFRQYENVKVVMAGENLGFSKANNVGVANSSGEYVLLLNSDTELKNNAVLAGVNFLRSKPGTAIIGCRLLNTDGSFQQSYFDFPNLSQLFSRLFRIYRYNVKPPECPVVVDWVTGAFFLFRRSLLDDFGGKLNEDYFLYCEDIQWCWDARKHGYNTMYEPSGEVYHHAGKSSSQSKQQRELKFYYPNLLRLLKKDRGNLYAWLYFLLLIAIYLSHVSSKESRDKAFALMKLLFLRHEDS